MQRRIRYLSGTLASATALALLVPPAAIAAPEPGGEVRGTVVATPLDGTADVVPVTDSGDSGDSADPADPADKISRAAEKTFAARGTTDFWLRFGEQPDLEPADGITVWSERGRYVYDALTAAAEKSQAGTIAELEKAGAEYTSYWAANAILVEDGTLDQAVELAADKDVVEVRPTVRYSAPEPVEVADEVDVEAAADTLTTWGVGAINADDMWAQGFTGDGVVVANLDSGVAPHSALSEQYRGAGASNPNAYNYFSADGLIYPHDTNAVSHGTHTMGTMVGGTVVREDVERAVGVAPGAQWIAAGVGDDLSDENLVAAGQWLLAPYDQASSEPTPDPARRPHVVNNSWGAEFSTDPFMENLITAWEAAGIFSTFSNGNAGKAGCSSAGSPASRLVNYGVGAFDMEGAIAPFSSRGPGQSGTVKPDIAAPGVHVLSTTRTGTAYLNGTSMAAPHVAGAVALLWDAVPELVGDVPATRAILDASAHDEDDTSCGGTADDNNVWGEGRLDVLAAYRLTQDEEEFEATPAPVVSGDDYRVGVPLTVTTPAWTPAASFGYQWRRDGRAISGATETTYTPTAADADTRLTVTVTGTADGRIPTTVTSAETREISEGLLEWSTPTISGTHRVGSTLRAHAGSWTPGTTFTYQWLASSGEIEGANGPTFTPTRDQLGMQITVQLNAFRRGYLPTLATSEGDGIPTVTSGLISQPDPVILGRATPGATLTASRPPSVPAANWVYYQWMLDGQPIRDATKSTLTVQSAWKGQVITVRVIVKASAYKDTTVTSAGSRVGGAYTKSPNPVISGTKRVGSTLTATRGTWSPTPTTFSFQWYADGRPISGATTFKYTLTGSDYQKKITVSVRAYRAGWGTTVRRSAATAEVLASAVRWRGEGEGQPISVGPDGLPRTTYIAQAGSAECFWQQNQFGGQLGSSAGSGQRLLTLLPNATNVMASESCGLWIKYHPGMVRPSDSTAVNGVYVLGDHLGRGEYSTSGPADADIPCRYFFYKDFHGRASSVISRGVVPEATTITTPDSATGFETVGCEWQRIN
ncbi:S8 family serine peptidase [Promicromonospora sukumoe]|uniref:S8 family serine peptidase n=1 Tax=Promicromonospora sukumoe TaxID=88382 RepID=UPI00039E0B12|nr:S8 family serine peptidase [Promicromonospora sukumoe]